LAGREYCAKDSSKNHFKHYLPVKNWRNGPSGAQKAELNVQKFNFACNVIGQKFSTLIKSPLGMEQKINGNDYCKKTCGKEN